MNRSKLTRKLYLQWYILRLCKTIPRTANELYEQIQEAITLPRSTATNISEQPTHSESLVRRYIKELETKDLLIHAGDAYSITKEGHKMETTLRLDLQERLKPIQRAVEKMSADLDGKKDRQDVLIVPPSDREFLRGAISIKDIVRYFTLSRLAQPGTEESIADLRHDMLETYGWTCSREYYYQLIRDELGDGQEYAREFNRDVNPALAHCVKARWAGERRNKRYYRITQKGHEWLEVFQRDATKAMVDAKVYIDTLIRLLE